ncbi:TonB-dependent receptor plug domain-containing protein [Balneolaceae bacterium YR4-1]|uniref:TonB-dependent receptor plug domain-containing protein n=1 Tax=Halalkalibaculum roseum TaxID=2709311 RepID=A0A6M1T2M3_9BACT|nr:TonB-dependent receptor [Halalkalibaculum roseum]NGP77017.1 TonB-dependent receptor plug domain-containing protein [Halalkalibaculum roseum]
MRYISAFLLFLSLFIAGQFSAFCQVQADTLIGTIYDETDQRPVSQARITISFPGNSDVEQIILTSNSEGSFTAAIPKIRPFTITVRHPEYLFKTIEYSLGEELNRTIMIELESALKEVQLEGRVLSVRDDEPIGMAEVRLQSIDGETVETDLIDKSGGDGRFQLNTTLNLNHSNRLVFSVNHPDYVSINTSTIYRPDTVFVLRAQAESNYIRLGGNVIDKTNGNPIEFATVQVLPASPNATLERSIGTATDLDGSFEFTFRFSVPFRLRFSHISYQTKELTITDPTYRRIKVELLPESVEGEEIYVISEIVSEDELKNTGTIDKISNLEIREIASMSAFDLVSTMREVDVSTQSINLQSISTRGFNSTANPRFLQLTDGIDNQAPGLGFPLGNLMGPSDLDIASMELLIGPSTTQYGSSAMSGVLLTHSKDPFVSQGFSFNAQVGTHDFKLGGADAWGVEGEGIYDFGLRYAQAVGEKFAFKITGTMITGTDWSANNYENLRSDKKWTENLLRDPGYNGVNLYGDESFSLLPVGFEIEEGFVPVSRTGYREEDLVDYDIATRKVGASLHYKFNEQSRVSVQGRYGYTNTLYTGDSRVRLEDFEMYQVHSELNLHNFMIRGYATTQYSGNSYNVNILANELISYAKNDINWFRDFELVYQNGRPIFGIPKGSVEAARDYADSGSTLLSGSEAVSRLEPGTPEYKEQLHRLKNITGFSEGAGIVDNSILYHTDVSNRFEDVLEGLDVTAGSSIRYYDLESKGTIFPDTTGNDITNYEYGLFLQFEKSFLDDNLNSIAAVRYDKNENFDYKLSQEVGFNYNLREKHYFRFSFQNGFRYPTVREQFINSNLGKARLLGGLSQINGNYELPLNAFTVQSVEDFNRAVSLDLRPLSGGYNREQAELNHLNILEQGILSEDGLPTIEPEITNSLELGYRQLINERLYVDLNYFVSLYDGFIGIKRFVKPRTSPVTDLFAAAGQINRVSENERYYVYSNSEGRVTAQGVSFDIQYTSGNFMSSLNGTWTQLTKETSDPIIPGYNTPPLKINFEWGARDLVTNGGFKMTFRARNGYDWQSSFLDGRVPAYGHFDFQFNIRFPAIQSRLKTGITNLGVTPYYDTFGGPAIGSILFTTFTFSPGGN